MRMFRSITFALGMALAAIASFPTYAVEFVSQTVYLSTITDFGVSQAKFGVELAQHRQAQVAHVDTVNSDLTREGHGFRQASATDIATSAEPVPRETRIC